MIKRRKDQKAFDLIKSLSNSERRYISINIDKYGGNKKVYSLLFSEISRSKVYDEEAIKRNILRKVEFSQFHVVKNYLLNTILKLLQNYYQDKTPSGIINSLLFESDYLFRKGLVSESIKRLVKAKKIAYKYEFFHLLIDILRREVKIYVSDYQTTNLIKSSDKVFEEENKVLCILKNISDLNQLSVALYLRITDSTISKKELKKYANEIINYPLLKKNYVAFCNQIVKNHILAEAYVIIGNHKKSYFHNQFQIDLFEKNPHQKIFLKSFYYPVLFNFIYKNIYLKNYSLAETLLEDLLLIVETTDNLHINLMYRYLHLKAFLFIKKGVFNKELYDKIEAFCTEKKSSLNNSSYMLLLFSNLALKLITTQPNLTNLSRKIMQIDYALVKDNAYKNVLLILTYITQDRLNNNKIKMNYALNYIKKHNANYEKLNYLEKSFLLFFKNKKLSEKKKKEIETCLNIYKTKNNNLDPDNIYNYYHFEDWLLKKVRS